METIKLVKKKHCLEINSKLFKKKFTEIFKEVENLTQCVVLHKKFVLAVIYNLILTKFNDKYFNNDKWKSDNFKENFSDMLKTDIEISNNLKNKLETTDVKFESLNEKVCEVFDYCQNYKTQFLELDDDSDEMLLNLIKTLRPELDASHNIVMTILQLVVEDA